MYPRDAAVVAYSAIDQYKSGVCRLTDIAVLHWLNDGKHVGSSSFPVGVKANSFVLGASDYTCGLGYDTYCDSGLSPIVGSILRRIPPSLLDVLVSLSLR